jgi:PTH1 family peptidyl-tRNA hydrolase
MALFQKKPQTGSSVPLYTLGLQKNVIIVGLGNPGKEYDGTRHNIGFAALDNLADKLDFPKWVEKKDQKSLITQQTIADTRVILVKPTTFMNNSGEAVQAVANFYKIAPQDILAVHDELAISFGQIRTRMGGSDAGHNGVKSLIQHLGKDFGRVRVGIHNDIAQKADSKDFVLGKFSKEEQGNMAALLRETNAVLSEYVHGQPLAGETRNFLI